MEAVKHLFSSLPYWVRVAPSCFFPLLLMGTVIPLTWWIEQSVEYRLQKKDAPAHLVVFLLLWMAISVLLASVASIGWLGPFTPLHSVLLPIVGVFLVTGLAAGRGIWRHMVWRKGNGAEKRRPPTTLQKKWELAMGGTRLVLACSVAALLWIGARVMLLEIEQQNGSSSLWTHVVIATTGGGARAFEQLGHARFVEGDVEGASRAFEAAAALDPTATVPRIALARLRMLLGDCRSATEATWEASVVAERSGNERERALVQSVRRELDGCRSR
ncbi:MAG: hypothetical protein NZM37_08935 [Sandaracinaceae bacterium]|nr:hypothetical protein [Sandaracinaceae bacterium]MDW8247257.1 hypothetical protein [Sandaracinaceae bacterium]